MREFLTFLTAVAVLAIAQTLIACLCFVVVLFAILSAVAFPRQTFGLAACLGLLTLAMQAPATCAGALGSIGVAAVVVSAMRRRRTPAVTSRSQPLLTYRSDPLSSGLDL